MKRGGVAEKLHAVMCDRLPLCGACAVSDWGQVRDCTRSLRWWTPLVGDDQVDVPERVLNN